MDECTHRRQITYTERLKKEKKRDRQRKIKERQTERSREVKRGQERERERKIKERQTEFKRERSRERLRETEREVGRVQERGWESSREKAYIPQLDGTIQASRV
jgi:hypothetical protein